MSALIKKISFLLVLSSLTISTFAQPGQPRADRESVHAARQPQDSSEKNGFQIGRNFQYPESDSSSEEGQKKNNRLSPEERRLLRRQINEAGQDLYVRKP
jgi:hypothetical protein